LSIDADRKSGISIIRSLASDPGFGLISGPKLESGFRDHQHQAGRLFVFNNEFSGNRTQDNHGAAIYTNGAAAIENSTFSANAAIGQGGDQLPNEGIGSLQRAIHVASRR